MISFVLAYFAVILLIAALLAAIGLDPLTAISGSITAVANVGPGMGPIIGPSTNFATLPDSAKWILSFGMLLGRLEILTVAVLFFPPSGSSNQRAREIEWRRVSRRRNAEGQPLAALLIA